MVAALGVAASLAALAMSGCGGTDSVASSRPEATNTAAARALTDVGGLPLPMTFGGPYEPLTAGRYRSDTFAIPIEMTLDEGWVSGGGELKELLDVYTASSEGAALDFWTLPTVIDPSDATGMTDIDAPSDLVAFLHEHDRLTTGPKEQVSVGGHPATAFEFTVDPSKTLSSPKCPGPCVPITDLSDGGQVGFLEGDRGRIFVVKRASGRPLVIAYSSSGADAAQLRVKSERVIKSLRLVS